jgi:hypothetical protein
MSAKSLDMIGTRLAAIHQVSGIAVLHGVPFARNEMCQCRSGLDDAELPCLDNTRPHVRLYTSIESR